jgi:ceroid-lipofuscinosis protein 6
MFDLTRYLVTEGQITPLFLLSLSLMQISYIRNKLFLNKYLDKNGMFLLVTFQLTLILVVSWSYCFWDDSVLRQKYPGLIYVPEPWSVYSLHFKNQYKLF